MPLDTRGPLHSTSPPRRPPSRAALLLPLYGLYNLRLELDEVVMLFPCGMLAFYYLSKVTLTLTLTLMPSTTSPR